MCVYPYIRGGFFPHITLSGLKSLMSAKSYRDIPKNVIIATWTKIGIEKNCEI